MSFDRKHRKNCAHLKAQLNNLAKAFEDFKTATEASARASAENEHTATSLRRRDLFEFSLKVLNLKAEVSDLRKISNDAALIYELYEDVDVLKTNLSKASSTLQAVQIIFVLILSVLIFSKLFL